MYEWVKAAHVISVLIFVGGLLALVIVSAVIGARGTAERNQSSALRDAMLSWNRRLTLPALILVWCFGLWAATSGGWFTEGWLQIKMLFVLGLSGLHGVLTGKLRRIDLDAPQAKSSSASVLLAVTVLSFAATAVLAVVKPF